METERPKGTREQVLARIHERLRRYVPEGRLLSEELIRERRAEAKREDRRLSSSKPSAR